MSMCVFVWGSADVEGDISVSFSEFTTGFNGILACCRMPIPRKRQSATYIHFVWNCDCFFVKFRVSFFHAISEFLWLIFFDEIWIEPIDCVMDNFKIKIKLHNGWVCMWIGGWMVVVSVISCFVFHLYFYIQSLQLRTPASFRTEIVCIWLHDWFGWNDVIETIGNHQMKTTSSVQRNVLKNPKKKKKEVEKSRDFVAVRR